MVTVRESNSRARGEGEIERESFSDKTPPRQTRRVTVRETEREEGLTL